MQTDSAPRIALTGATGFVGSALLPALTAAGLDVVGLTRNSAAARARRPDMEWIQADINESSQVESALQGCAAAYYLVHGMGEADREFRQHEVRAAEGFAAAAARAGVGRIIYLGGVAPRHHASEHLASRLEVGEALRSGAVPTLELRASMIIGAGSLSWLMVRDLAARLPVMVLPRWLRSRTEPVAIDDVVAALHRALDLPLTASLWYDVPGPAIMTGSEILAVTARIIGVERRLVVEVPVLTPWLSSHWVRLVTRAQWSVAREIVMGLTEDLLARDAVYWDLVGHPDRLSFEDAARRALAGAQGEAPITGFWGAVERLVRTA